MNQDFRDDVSDCWLQWMSPWMYTGPQVPMAGQLSGHEIPIARPPYLYDMQFYVTPRRRSLGSE